MKQTIPVVMAATLVAAGCSTINPYSGEHQTAKATSGAVIGAAVGALAGIATSDSARERRERALRGAGIGAIAGAGVGRYMDVQEARLRERLAGTGVSVLRDGENIILNMPGNITFDTDQSLVKADFRPVLESVAEVLREYRSTMIQVAGHTDSTGGDQYNMLLSRNRAQEVANVLTGVGVQPVRIEVIGFGETSPIATNSTPEGRALNRRVELTLLPLTE